MIIAKLDMDGTFRLQTRIAVLLHFLAAISKNRLLCKSWQLLATVKLTNYVIKWRGKMHFSKYTQFSFSFAVCPKINTVLFFEKVILVSFQVRNFGPKTSLLLDFATDQSRLIYNFQFVKMLVSCNIFKCGFFSKIKIQGLQNY